MPTDTASPVSAAEASGPETVAPEPANRPKLWRYYRERGLTPAEVGVVFERSDEWVRLVCLPFDDPKRRIPAQADVERAFEWSRGEITPADWYPPHLSPDRASASERAA